MLGPKHTQTSKVVKSRSTCPVWVVSSDSGVILVACHMLGWEGSVLGTWAGNIQMENGVRMDRFSEKPASMLGHANEEPPAAAKSIEDCYLALYRVRGTWSSPVLSKGKVGSTGALRLPQLPAA